MACQSMLLMGLCMGHASAAEIIVAQVAPLSGPDAAQGRAYSEGMKLHFDRVNKQGGAGGHRFSLVRKDDLGHSENTLGLTQQLLKETRPTVLAGFFGAQGLKSLADSRLLELEKIALVGVRNAQITGELPKNVFCIRAGAKEEINKIVQHIAALGMRRIGVFVEESPSNAALTKELADAAQARAAVLIAPVTYTPGNGRIAAAVSKLMQAAPQAIVIFASGSGIAGFVEQYTAAGGGAQIFLLSEADVDQLSKRLAPEQLKGIVIAQVVPNPARAAHRLSKELQGVLADGSKDAKPSHAMMEGYIAAKLIVAAAKKAGARANREGLLAALNTMDSVDLGDFVVGFSANSKVGSKYVELSIVSEDGRIKQ